MDDIRQRFLRDRIMTATPLQRVVMLYDRLTLDVSRARAAESRELARPHLSHATQVVAELLGSLDQSVQGGPGANLAGLYGHLLNELLGVQLSNGGSDDVRLAALEPIIRELGTAWSRLADGEHTLVGESSMAGASATAGASAALRAHQQAASVPAMAGSWTA